MTTEKKILFLVIFFSLIIRLTGLNYGLPLWLVADEPPFVLGSLKMIELKTILPRTHLAEFNSVLYYPPYISYFYLPFFVSALVFDYFSFSGNFSEFSQYIASDLSEFFRIARLINIILSIISIYLVYRISKNIFKDEYAALASAFLLGTSLLYLLLSFSSRQWLSIAFLLTIILYILTKDSINFNKKYLLSFLVAGIGLGISAITSIFVILNLFFYFFYEKKRFFQIFRQKIMYVSLFTLILLAFLPLYLYPFSLGFRSAITLFSDKSLWGIVSSPYFFLKSLIKAESILMFLFLIGIVISFKKKKEIFWPFFLFTILYSIVFYIFFRFEDRFIVPLIPIFAILGGYGFREFWKYIFSYEKIIGSAVMIVFIIFPIIFSARIGYLAFQNDSRENARKWIEKNIPEKENIIVSARLMRLSINKEGFEIQNQIDPNSLRQVDRAEANFGGSPFYPSYSALNLNSVDNGKISENFDLISDAKYLALQEKDYRKDARLDEKFKTLTSKGSILASFGEDAHFSISESELGENPFDLLKTTMLGPAVSIYKLR